MARVRWNNTISVAIVGSGPAGCYTAKYLQKSLKQNEDASISIDILDRLPTPFGLVRSGVAPDHPEVKNVQNDFTTLFETDNLPLSFLGNVTVGRDVSLDELRSLYDIVILAYGCESDRKLQIPGEDSLEGVMSAREFVSWYNSHPDYTEIDKAVAKTFSSEKCRHVVVIGHGNVALDCARILAKGCSKSNGLGNTDIASHAWSTLQNNDNPIMITIVGRRGHIQGAFTIKELRELTKLEEEGYNAIFSILPDELELGSTPPSLSQLEKSRPKKRIDKLLRQIANSSSLASTSTNQNHVKLRFLLNPVSFEPSSNPSEKSKLGYVRCERTMLVPQKDNPDDGQRQVAVGTGEYCDIPAQLALVSVGYQGVPIDGLERSFQEETGTVRNLQGRVDSEGPGLYVTGWLKRGPSGIIGTNAVDAKETVAAILQDLQDEKLPLNSNGGTPKLMQLLQDRQVKVVNWEAYKKIDLVETNSARKRNQEQPRNKLPTYDELLKAAF
eukprot:CAMPEP_0194225866 /NCGR_PEP_ID=MMETSP0156-20130528/40538_1 /TAXON_ID=33649 /ORGANISM="Thalassionema nitzschioides, Strain L26-B" /LENGTH=498 /DNA_ID=CAMNT_0038957991 /DNA_START=164 /DNA_END=1660 /DNA_ORIENTATION=+